MSKSTLRQVLTTFEQGGSRSLSQIARDLDVSPARLEGMIQYWVRKGKIRETVSYTECGTCGHDANSCPFVLEMPRHYELVRENDQHIALNTVDTTCRHCQ